MKVIVDTNIWLIYMMENSDLHEDIVPILERHLKDSQIFINTIIAMETLYFIIKKIGKEEGLKKFKLILRGNITICGFPKDQFFNLVDKLALQNVVSLKAFDTSILVTMEKYDISTIITHDQQFKSVSGINVIDPVS